MINKNENLVGYATLDVIDKNGKVFSIWQGGNFDLYWSTTEEVLQFEICQTDKDVYKIFDQLFQNVLKQDDKRFGSLVNGNTFYWISEDDEPEKSNRMKITNIQDSYKIVFEKNLKHMQPRLFTSVCFCNSGSNYPRVVECFMKMYLKNAYNIDFSEKY